MYTDIVKVKGVKCTIYHDEEPFQQLLEEDSFDFCITDHDEITQCNQVTVGKVFAITSFIKIDDRISTSKSKTIVSLNYIALDLCQELAQIHLTCPHPMIPVIFKFINIIRLSRLTVIRSFYDRHNTFRSHAPMTITVCPAPARRGSPVIELPDQRPEAASWTRQPFHWILRLLISINTLVLISLYHYDQPLQN